MPPKKDAGPLKPTKCSQAIARWEEKHQTSAAEAKRVALCFQRPPMEVMDKSLGVLQKCEMLYLSTNRIEKIAGLNELTNLRLISLARNRLTSIKGLEVVRHSLEGLFLSYNYLQALRGIDQFTKLNCLTVMFNQLEMPEINKLAKMDAQFKDIALYGNKASGKLTEPEWKEIMVKKFPTCRYLEGESRFTISPAELEKVTGGLSIEPKFTKSELKLLEEVKVIYGIPSGEEEADDEGAQEPAED